MGDEEKRPDYSEKVESWDQWESNLVKWSLVIGVIALIILGTLINLFILN